LFIELTDHLRCPADHDESYLVLLPDQMDGRSVRSGQLGCPVCGRTFQVIDGVFDTQDAPKESPDSTIELLDAESVGALVGLSGPGGYLVMVGAVSEAAEKLAEANPGVALVLVNPSPGTTDSPRMSVLRSGRIPLKTRSMRGVVLSRPYADDLNWVREAVRVVLPGLRVVGEGANPPPDVIDLMASAGGVWVGAVRR
jgi:hypothetical protein